MRAELRIVLAVGTLFWIQEPSWAQNPQTETVVVAPSAEPGSTLADVPLGGAIVTYENGDLTIKARGAPLIEVLRAVCTRIGAKLDFQSDLRDRIVGFIGPGPVREVLTSLLLGSHVNFVIQRSDADPMALGHVLTFPGSTDPGKQGFEPLQQYQTSAGEVTSTTTAVSDNSGANVLSELLIQAKADVAAAATDAKQDDGTSGEVNTAAKVDATVSKEAEAQLKAIEKLFDTPDADSPSPQTAPQNEVQTSSSADPKTNAEMSSPFIPNRRRRK